MRDRGTKYFGPGRNLSIFLCVFDQCTEVLMNIQFNRTNSCNTDTFASLRCFCARCHSLLTDLRTGSGTAVCYACLLGAPEGNSNARKLGTVRIQVAIRQGSHLSGCISCKQQHTFHLSEFKIDLVSPLSPTWELL